MFDLRALPANLSGIEDLCVATDVSAATSKGRRLNINGVTTTSTTFDMTPSPASFGSLRLIFSGAFPTGRANEASCEVDAKTASAPVLKLEGLGSNCAVVKATSTRAAFLKCP